MPETEKAAPKRRTRRKKKAPAKPKRLMYIGVTIPGVAIHNRVYIGIPKGAQKTIEKEPEFGNLFVPVSKQPEANRMIREGKGYAYSAYLVSLKVKGGK